MDSNTTTIISVFMIMATALVWPYVSTAAQHTLRMLEAHLPANQQALLDTYAKMAVRYVEQALKDKANEDKKAMAMDIVTKLLIAAKLPLPNMAILGATIEAAVYLLNQDKLFDQQKSPVQPAPTK